MLVGAYFPELINGVVVYAPTSGRPACRPRWSRWSVGDRPIAAGSPIPFQPAGTTLIHPVTGGLIALGGTRPADAAARRDGWPKVLEFLDQLS